MDHYRVEFYAEDDLFEDPKMDPVVSCQADTLPQAQRIVKRFFSLSDSIDTAMVWEVREGISFHRCNFIRNEGA